MQKKIALVTGGSRGIGAAIVTALARDNYKVIVHYNKSKNKAEALAKKVNGIAIKSDFSKDIEINALFKKIKKDFGKLDVLVNNAGIAELDSLDALSSKSFFKTMQVNTWASLLCTQLGKKLMKKGNIVFISSICAQNPTPDALAYAISKAGINSFASSITKELAPEIRVNIIAPGATDTDIYKKNYSKKDKIWVIDTYPMARPCEPIDIAEMVSFLISDKAKNITGQIFTVDGGFSVAKV